MQKQPDAKTIENVLKQEDIKEHNTNKQNTETGERIPKRRDNKAEMLSRNRRTLYWNSRTYL